MEPIEGVDLKKLVEQCKTEFDKEKQIIEINNEVTVVMTTEEVKKYYDSINRSCGRRRRDTGKETPEQFKKRNWLERKRKWMRP
jgi:hypothetical protein